MTEDDCGENHYDENHYDENHCDENDYDENHYDDNHYDENHYDDCGSHTKNYGIICEFSPNDKGYADDDYNH